jgi:hypothetical protein
MDGPCRKHCGNAQKILVKKLQEKRPFRTLEHANENTIKMALKAI